MKHPIKTSSSNSDRRLSRGNGGGDPRLERALRFFDQRFAERVTMKEAARVACLSPNYFVEVFRSAVGCTPHQYLVRCRLRRARQLIASEGHRQSLAELAWAAGFADQAHLTRHFQRAFGQSPGQWRQQILCKTGFHFPEFCSRRIAIVLECTAPGPNPFKADKGEATAQIMAGYAKASLAKLKEWFA